MVGAALDHGDVRDIVDRAAMPNGRVEVVAVAGLLHLVHEAVDEPDCGPVVTFLGSRAVEQPQGAGLQFIALALGRAMVTGKLPFFKLRFLLITNCSVIC